MEVQYNLFDQFVGAVGLYWCVFVLGVIYVIKPLTLRGWLCVLQISVSPLSVCVCIADWFRLKIGSMSFWLGSSVITGISVILGFAYGFSRMI